MAEKKHEPISGEPTLMSPEKRAWWAATWAARPSPKQPRLAVLSYVMSATMRPTARDETILHGYMALNKFHDREPELLLAEIEKLDPGFFEAYPRNPGTKLDDAFKRAAIGEAARCFFRHGLSAYGKPGLRRKAGPLAAL